QNEIFTQQPLEGSGKTGAILLVMWIKMKFKVDPQPMFHDKLWLSQYSLPNIKVILMQIQVLM
ncbi:hypothetical protein FQN50_009343, partial [Emmonsiellopsis sp. PD_5]